MCSTSKEIKIMLQTAFLCKLNFIRFIDYQEVRITERRGRERASHHQLYFLTSCSSKGLRRVKVRARRFLQISHVHAGAQALGPCSVILPGTLESWTRSQADGTTGSVLTSAPALTPPFTSALQLLFHCQTVFFFFLKITAFKKSKYELANNIIYMLPWQKKKTCTKLRLVFSYFSYNFNQVFTVCSRKQLRCLTAQLTCQGNSKNSIQPQDKISSIRYYLY